MLSNAGPPNSAGLATRRLAGGQTLQICDMLYVEIGVFVTVTSPCLLLTPSRQAVPAMPALLDCTALGQNRRYSYV